MIEEVYASFLKEAELAEFKLTEQELNELEKLGKGRTRQDTGRGGKLPEVVYNGGD